MAAFDPLPDQEIPAFRIFDLDNQDASIDKIVKSYGTVVQNLRLIKRPGINRWSQQGKRWSEAALGEDKEGRVLFIFSRSPYSMHDLNSELLSMDLGLVAAQHLEGGPEAQLYLNIDNVSLDLFGSFETNFQENNDNNSAWPIPNCLGIKPKR